jgi:hypothetical protein
MVPGMSAILYSVKNWDKLYENNDSRKVKTCRYVYTPNKHDGAGYGRMMAHPEGERLFAAWNAIIQVASKMPNRGILSTNPETPGNFPGNPGDFLTAEDLAFRTRLKPETFKIALDFFSHPEMGWLELKTSNSIEKRNEREIIPELPPEPGNNGVEGKGTEGKGREYKEGDFEQLSKEEEMGRKKEIVQQDLICHQFLEDPCFMEAWTGFLEMRKEIKKPATEYAQKLLLRKLRNYSAEDINDAIAILEQSVTSSWQDIFPLRKNKSSNSHRFPARGQSEGDRPDLDFIQTGTDA